MRFLWLQYHIGRGHISAAMGSDLYKVFQQRANEWWAFYFDTLSGGWQEASSDWKTFGSLKLLYRYVCLSNVLLHLMKLVEKVQLGLMQPVVVALCEVWSLIFNWNVSLFSMWGLFENVTWVVDKAHRKNSNFWHDSGQHKDEEVELLFRYWSIAGCDWHSPLFVLPLRKGNGFISILVQGIHFAPTKCLPLPCLFYLPWLLCYWTDEQMGQDDVNAGLLVALWFLSGYSVDWSWAVADSWFRVLGRVRNISSMTMWYDIMNRSSNTSNHFHLTLLGAHTVVVALFHCHAQWSWWSHFFVRGFLRSRLFDIDYLKWVLMEEVELLRYSTDATHAFYSPGWLPCTGKWSSTIFHCDPLYWLSGQQGVGISERWHCVHQQTDWWWGTTSASTSMTITVFSIHYGIAYLHVFLSSCSNRIESCGRKFRSISVT